MLQPIQVFHAPVTDCERHTLNVVCHTIEVAAVSGRELDTAVLALRHRDSVAIKLISLVFMELDLHMELMLCVNANSAPWLVNVINHV